MKGKEVFEFGLVKGILSEKELEIVRNSRKSSSLIYTSQNFLHLISNYLKSELYQIVAKKDGQIVGYMPYIQKTSKHGTIVNSLPFFGSNGGPISILNQESVDNYLLKEFLNRVSSIPKILSSTVIENPFEPLNRDIEGLTVIGKPTDVRVGQVTNLSNLDNEEDLIQILSQPRPRNIKKARKLGIEVVEDRSSAAVHFLFESHQLNIGQKNGLTKSFEFYEKLTSQLDSNEWKIHVAKLDKKPISALLTLRYNNIVEYFTPTIINEFRDTQASSLIIFEVMRECISEGFNYWNWGGTWTSQKGVYDFKKRWGAYDKIYNYFTRIYDESIYQIPKEELMLYYPNFYAYPFETMKLV